MSTGMPAGVGRGGEGGLDSPPKGDGLREGTASTCSTNSRLSQWADGDTRMPSFSSASQQNSCHVLCSMGAAQAHMCSMWLAVRDAHAARCLAGRSCPWCHSMDRQSEGEAGMSGGTPVGSHLAGQYEPARWLAAEQQLPCA